MQCLLLLQGETFTNAKQPKQQKAGKIPKRTLLGKPEIVFGIQNSTIKSDRNVGQDNGRTSVVKPTRGARAL